MSGLMEGPQQLHRDREEEEEEEKDEEWIKTEVGKKGSMREVECEAEWGWKYLGRIILRGENKLLHSCFIEVLKRKMGKSKQNR